MIGPIGCRERHLSIAAIDRRRRGIDEVQQPRQPAGRLQQHDLSIDIAAQVGVRIDQRVSNAGLGRQVHDAIYPVFLGEQRRDGLAIGDVEAPEGEAGPARKSGQPRLL